MPNLIPRDVHHLWLQPNEKPNNKNKPESTRTNLYRRTPEDDYDLNQLQRSAYAPPLSAYSSERPGAILPSRDISSAGSDQNDAILNDIEFRTRELKTIKTLGYSYLAPLGVGKTMKALNEEMEIKRQMDEQYQAEAPTAENLLGEGDNVDDPELNEDIQNDNVQNVNSTSASASLGTPRRIQPEETQNDSQIETQATEQINLDDEIPEAEENSYDHIYDQANDHSEEEIFYDGQPAYERQYDQDFMVSEEYQVEENLQTPPVRTRGVQTRDQLVTPEISNGGANTTIGNDRNNGRTNASFSSSFNSFHNNAHASFNDTTTHPGDISINESDLDMVLDDD